LNPVVIETAEIVLPAAEALPLPVVGTTLLARTTDETATMIDVTVLEAEVPMIAIESETENEIATETVM
jgi:hypothetical protein